MLVCSVTGLLFTGATAGDGELWNELRLMEALVAVGQLPAGLSTMSTSCEAGRKGEAALPTAEEAGGGSSRFGEG